ncbi:MAG: glycosyltransferase family 2 protein [Pseudomonadota bacterium]
MHADPLVSVVIPVKDEAANVTTLAREIRQALDGVVSFEVIFVDDGSTDATVATLAALKTEFDGRLRVLRHLRNAGQSAAITSGVRAARGLWIATLDGDGQNDPADLPNLLARVDLTRDPPARVLVQGARLRREDDWLRRISSRVANAVRGALLQDQTPDSGCGIKVLPRALYLELPYFDHMHRFMPALALRAGAIVQCVGVHHRPRGGGQSKYGLNNRLWAGIVDLLGVMWLRRRARLDFQAREES